MMVDDASTHQAALAPLASLLSAHATAREVLALAPGAPIFAPGEAADTVYLVRAGKVIVDRGGDGGHTRTFGEGFLLGVEEALARAPRRTRARADGEVVLDAFAASDFIHAIGLDSALYESVQAVLRVAALHRDVPGHLAWTQRDGHRAIALRLTLDDGASALVHHTPEPLRWEALRAGDDGGERVERRWEDRDRHLVRTLVTREARLLGFDVRGPWRDLATALTRLIDGSPLPADTFERFAQSGEIEASPPAASASGDIVCHCLRLTHAALREARERGVNSIAATRATTGASSVCGACTARVAEIVGDVLGAPFRLVGELEVAPNVRTFRLAPADGAPLSPSKAGQHVVLAAKVDDRWVHRSYTLTNPAGERSVREITVKKEPYGQLSSWLFDRRPAEPELRVSAPQGTFCPNLARPEPIVLLVGGVGVTPALAVVRTLVANGSRARVHLDYSAYAEDGFAYRDELAAIALRHPNISVHFRVTARGDLLGPQSISALAGEHPRAQWFLCGPPGYVRAARGALAELGVDTRQVHVESFAPDATISHLAPPREVGDSLAFFLGLLLLVAYLAQHLFEWRLPALEALQADQAYKRWTGALLLAFVASQWLLPGLRLAGRLRTAARVYRWHRYLGALAPLFLWLHASRPGVAYLALLAGIYLTNTAVGLCDKTLVRDSQRRLRYFRVWLVPHIVLACATVALALIHLYIVFAYQGAGS